ncbi:Miniconductance mechanosensitive channel MscM [subsurface metagenome]
MLEVEIFGRLNLPRGVPMAISSLTQYFLIVLGFMIAMSFVGINLKSLSILIGALGVGIGFGLQHTVNNFISGLILAFERPVTIGDIVNVEGLEGVVMKIGIRASTIRQWDGSHVIVPNADLISSKVINWNLTKYERRFILTIHTNLKTDADKVLKLMKEAAESVEYVLSNPEAKSYFHGIKDKYMEFALFYWTSDNILECKSLVNLAVQKALAKEGIDFVMPIPLIIQEKKENEVSGAGKKSRGKD